MKKRKPQSTQAPSCTTILHKAFFSFPTPFEIFKDTSFDENQ
jgi:hypothetical protein